MYVCSVIPSTTTLIIQTPVTANQLAGFDTEQALTEIYWRHHNIIYTEKFIRRGESGTATTSQTNPPIIKGSDWNILIIVTESSLPDVIASYINHCRKQKV